ncbi:MAG: class I SAM-dependent methyltransferase [Humidesulfovibrio sp.]|uniref:class I SAM-dependent methyltransferase n=1 Tax=Humidesulfovibrio sp. TaxID=2910988 RepID=UPI0027EEC212|nr:class I SAM-dependent methyltransferase [Humidesulfovibrio sp.]MDQ7834251.1 class I SAM-dependent methyltransferase [Humidesulfovibrio sp.]
MYWLEQGDYERIYDGLAYKAETGDADSFIRQRFQTIISLPPAKSDNAQRVARVREYASTRLDFSHPRQVLDIGAGMGVFLHQFLDSRWQGTAIEPDPSACEHMRSVLPTARIIQRYIDQVDLPEHFDLITMNRTLEHVPNPIAFLRHAAKLLKPTGIAYVELPDVRAFYLNGPHDQDFAYGHYVVYTPSALVHIGREADLDLHRLQRVIEPSGKHTIYGFFLKSPPRPEQGGVKA